MRNEDACYVFPLTCNLTLMTRLNRILNPNARSLLFASFIATDRNRYLTVITTKLEYVPEVCSAVETKSWSHDEIIH